MEEGGSYSRSSTNVDELKKTLEGQAVPVGHGVTNGWSYSKTANDLGISKPAVVKAIEIASAIEQYPDLAQLLARRRTDSS